MSEHPANNNASAKNPNDDFGGANKRILELEQELQITRQNLSNLLGSVELDQIKKIEFQLENKKQALKRQLNAIEAASDGIAILNEDKFVYLNQAHLDIFGYSNSAELIGQSWRILYQPEELALFEQEVFPILQERGKWQGTATALHRDGHTFDEELTLTSTDTGDLICICRDISQRLQAEAELRRQKAELSQLNQQLEKRVARRTQSLANFSDNLKQLHRLATNNYETIADLFTDYLKTGCKIFHLSTGIVGQVENGIYKILAVEPPLDLSVGFETNYADTYCAKVINEKATITYMQVGAMEEMLGHPIYQTLKLESYIGTPIFVNGMVYGVLSFSDNTPRTQEFESYTREIIELMARDIGQFIATWKTEQALQASERRFRNAFEQAAVGIAHIAPDGTWLRVNQKLCQIVGYTQEELLQKTFPDITHPKDLNTDLKYVQQILTGAIETLSVEKRYIRPDNCLVWINLTVSLVKKDSGELDYFIFVVEDISSRKHTETALKASEIRFRNTFEQAAVGIAHIAPEGKFLKVNQRLCKIVGYDSDRLLNLTFQEITHPQDLDTDLKYIQQMLAGIVEIYSREKRYIRSDGSIVWINLTVSLVKKNSGEPDYFISVVEDIGRRKKNEIALAKVSQKLQQANQAKDSFIAHMSHELRTPLNSILGFSSILQKDPNLTTEQRHGINLVHQSGKHLLTLINDILDFSKIEAGKLRLESSVFNLSQFLDNLVDMFGFRAKQKGLKFEFQADPSLPIMVKADETRLRQVLLNLLSNAIKFTETGSIIFTVGCGENPLNTQLIRFQVQDTGIGIPQHKLAEIFAPFVQLDNHLDEQEGTGLGLSISKNIIQLMDSQIHLESTVGGGSKFWFDLNLPSEPGSASLQPQSNQYSNQCLQQPCKILVVDDNIDNRYLLVSYLQSLGFIVEEAQNGAEGLAKAQIFAPDAILLDLVMPVMDGKEMAAKIKQQTKLQDTVVVIISANSQSILNPEQIDCDGFLSKPVDLEKLLVVLTTNLELEWTIHQVTEMITADNSTIFAPPPSELVELLKLAQLGDIAAIAAKCQSLAASDTQYTGFVRQVQQMSSSFQQHKLIKFIENFCQIDPRNC